MVKRREQRLKLRELQHLHRLRKCYPAFPEGEIVPGERPDFSIRSNGDTVGIEHRQLFLDESRGVGSQLRAKEGEWTKAVRNAQLRYEQRDALPPVDVSVFWLDHYNLTSRRRKELEAEIAECVACNLPPEGSYITLGQTGLPGSPLPREVTCLRIARFDFVTENYWNYPRSGFVGSLDLEYLKKAIADKERSLTSYSKSLNSAWLLLVVEGLHASSLLEVPSDIRFTIFRTAFDRILLLRYFEEEVIELQVESKGA